MSGPGQQQVNPGGGAGERDERQRRVQELRQVLATELGQERAGDLTDAHLKVLVEAGYRRAANVMDAAETGGLQSLNLPHAHRADLQAHFQGPAQQHRHKLPPTGSVLALQEVFADGSKRTCGTASILYKTGLAITARHCVVWEDGCFHPNRLCVAGRPDIQVQHLASFPDVDITALMLVQLPASNSVSAAGSSTTADWPSLLPAQQEPIGLGLRDEPVMLYGFQTGTEGEGLLSPTQPLAMHGKLSHYTFAGMAGVVEYQGFPNMSGGPVVWDGQFLGTHVCNITYGEDSQATDVPLPSMRFETEIVCLDDPAPSGSTAAGHSTTASGEPSTVFMRQLAACEAHLMDLQVACRSRAQVGLFVPSWTILQRLLACGAVPRGPVELQLLAGAKRWQYRH